MEIVQKEVEYVKEAICIYMIILDQHLTETSDSLNSSIQINQNEILLSLTLAIQEEIQFKQDSQFMTLFLGLNLEQIRNNANTIHATPLLNQRLLQIKRSPKQTPLARKSQRRFCEEV
ncbi:Hypothetical_protein [Hexamita inflata]|uniref:Hypothetical_protein n=1 Tax=Hexamita inflata TaxID=28002 RepID=A0AA86RI24_9EUKA|nr:Hypothetical protein HINF_LOCUS62818 [Hexamita inflata]